MPPLLFGEKGLVDYYLKSKFKTSSSLMINADLHWFESASEVVVNIVKLNKSFGTELDITAAYTLTPIIGFQVGYEHFFATPTLTSSAVKNVPTPRLSDDWAYLSIDIKPDFLVNK